MTDREKAKKMRDCVKRNLFHVEAHKKRLENMNEKDKGNFGTDSKEEWEHHEFLAECAEIAANEFENRAKGNGSTRALI